MSSGAPNSPNGRGEAIRDWERETEQGQQLGRQQTRLLKRLEMGFQPGSTVYVTRSPDPWVQKLAAPARVTSTELTETAPTPVATPANHVSIVDNQTTLKAETITVTADVTPIP